MIIRLTGSDVLADEETTKIKIEDHPDFETKMLIVMVTRAKCQNCKDMKPSVFELAKNKKIKVGIIEDDRTLEDRIFEKKLLKVKGKVFDPEVFPIFLVFQYGALINVYENKINLEELLFVTAMS